jgi:hypothetical protein
MALSPAAVLRRLSGLRQIITDHALNGRLFVPSLVSLSAAAGSGHTAQFHMNDRAFLDEISEFVGSTLQSGESIVVVATEETRGGIGERLKREALTCQR